MALVFAAGLGTALVTAGCEQKQPTPTPASSAEPARTPSAAPEPDKPRVVAYPPGQGPPDAAPTAPREPRTGVCSLLETGYDGDNTRSTEKLIVKIKDDRVVAAQYSYRGSYALDGKVETLNVPLVDAKWIELEMPMTTGTKKFSIRLRSDVMDAKGTAAQEPEGRCTWEEPPADTKKSKK